jgi:hypothetical protein
MTKASTFPAAAALDGDEQFIANDTGVTSQATIAALLTLILADAGLTESVQDIVGSLVVAGDNLTVTYDDNANSLTIGKVIKDNLSSTSEPVATDDNTQGYAVGSRWLNTITGIIYVCADATTNAAKWNAQAACPEHPGYIAGLWYPSTIRRLAPAGVTTTTNTIYLTPLLLAHRVTIDGLGIRLNSSASAGATARIGIYTSKNGLPDALVAQTNGTFAIDGGSGEKIGSVSPSVVLDANAYWFAYTNSVAVSLLQGVLSSDTLHQSQLGATSLANLLTANNQISGLTAAQTYASGLPASLGAGSGYTLTKVTGSFPVGAFRVA